MEAAPMRIVLLGEQATGKSSMIVALYGALLHRRAGEMRIRRSIDDVEFLSRGLEAMGRFESVRRTEADAEARLLLEISRERQSVTIELPDRSGELLRNMIDTRLWDPQLHALVDGADAAMLFLRSDWLAAESGTDGGGPFAEPIAARAIADGDGAHAAAAAPGAELSEPPVDQGGSPFPSFSEVREGSPEPAEPPTADPAPDVGDHEAPHQSADVPASAPAVEPGPWTPSQMPVDVRAVDLLQETLEERSAMLPIVVIVSAWDREATRGVAPSQWLAQHVPLLAQFLDSNSDQLPHAVFGVSAQGRDFDDERPADAQDPWDRAYLVGPDGTAGTLAAPIEWLLDVAA
jgi:Double-GTPase 1